MDVRREFSGCRSFNNIAMFRKWIHVQVLWCTQVLSFEEGENPRSICDKGNGLPVKRVRDVPLEDVSEM